MAFPTGDKNPAKDPRVRKILSAQKMGSKNPRWKGGRTFTYSHAEKDKTNPYILIKTHGHPNADKQNYVPEHRLVMEKSIGRYLRPKEEVHHINNIKSDNRIENLRLFSSSSEHTKYEILTYPHRFGLSMLGKKHSKETLKKMSDSHKKRWAKVNASGGVNWRKESNHVYIRCKTCNKKIDCYKCGYD